jgi:hypothetical protein
VYGTETVTSSRNAHLLLLVPIFTFRMRGTTHPIPHICRLNTDVRTYKDDITLPTAIPNRLPRDSVTGNQTENGSRITWNKLRWCQWLRGLRRRAAAERLLGSWVRMSPGVWMFVSCTVFVFSGRGLCDGPIPRPEESYRLWCVSECDQVKINNLDTCCE